MTYWKFHHPRNNGTTPAKPCWVLLLAVATYTVMIVAVDVFRLFIRDMAMGRPRDVKLVEGIEIGQTGLGGARQGGL